MVNYSYDDIVNGLNAGIIKAFIFSVSNYPHYKKCSISHFTDVISTDRNISRIEVKLTDDNSETISFIKNFKDDYKIFKMGRKGTFTLRQMWPKIQVLEIRYNEKFASND